MHASLHIVNNGQSNQNRLQNCEVYLRTVNVPSRSPLRISS